MNLRRICALTIGFSLALALSGRAAMPGAETESAAAAVADGIPEVAVTRLEHLLRTAKSDEEWKNAAEQLVPASIAAGQTAEALKLLEDPRLKNSPRAGFWRAQVLAAQHLWKDALPYFEAAAAATDSLVAKEATLGRAEMLRALGRKEEALKALAPLLNDRDSGVRARFDSAEMLLDAGDWNAAERLLNDMDPQALSQRKERRFLRGRVELARKHPERAAGTFEALVKRPEGASHALILSALFGVADAHLQLNTPESGDDFLEDFIDRHPQDPNLAQIFGKLDDLYRAERKPARVELEKWTREPEQPRRALAQWYRARIELRAGHRDRALQLLGEMRKGGAQLSALATAYLEYAELAAEEKHAEEAIAILEEAKTLHPPAAVLDRINLLAGELQYDLGQFDRATAHFEETAHSDSPLANTSRFNAALGWLQVGDQPHFLADAKEVAKEPDGEASTADLRLAEGLVEAAKGDKAAADTLAKFVHEFPNNPRVSEALVALAEVAVHATPPRLAEAQQYLARAAEAKPTEAATEHADYLSIWLEEVKPGNEAAVIDRANRFLTAHPDSRLVPDVRMKLAETYFRRQDFANAQTQFETLAEKNPTGATGEKALFFAAESSMSTMGPHSLDRAIELFDRVVQLKGELRWAARNEQAAIERRLGKPKDALLLYDEVLKSEARSNDKREALCGKGDVYFELGSEDPKNYDRAIESYDQLIAESTQAGHWRNQALFKKGVCLEKKSDAAGALAIFYSVLEEAGQPNKSPELFWFYKAGFNAARLLEDAAKWESAASVYEKLVAAGGSRSEEAQARLNRLRLEHFLWGN